MRGLSLFANVGIAELLLKDAGHEVVIANEIEKKRAEFYKYSHPDTNMIVGDITNKNIKNQITSSSKKSKVDFIMATPPCQGMSLNGLKKEFDARNQLITHAIDVILSVNPKYIFLENVPQQNKTKIIYDEKVMLVPEYIKLKLEGKYHIESKIIDTSDFGVPQKRKRLIYLMSKRGSKKWIFPEHKNSIVTVRDAIGHLKSLQPFCREKGTLKDRRNEEHALHLTPIHNKNHIKWMTHTESGKSAFENKIHFPQKQDGTRISGGAYAYMRMHWDKPAPTVTTNNGVISSFTNVHPGRMISKNKYSDPRVLTIYEIMLISSIPTDWQVPTWASEKLIRTVIGEGIPPLAVSEIFKEL